MLPPRPLKHRIKKSTNDDVAVVVANYKTWRDYFDQQFTFELPSDEGGVDKFVVYFAGSVKNNILFCLHGGGHTSQSWCLVAEILKEEFCVIAYDCRGHGLTQCQAPGDLSSSRLVNDGLKVLHKVKEWVDRERSTLQEAGELGKLDLENMSITEKIFMQSRTEGVPVILMGHSMGGAIAIQIAASQKVPNLQGLIVLDVVEVTALEALSQMESFVKKFPTQFASLEEAIEWSLRHVLTNRKSAEVSVPSQLIQDETTGVWKWRVSLLPTAHFWDGWFRGISQMFLQSKVGSGGKVLVLVGHERLDKDLTIGHMQGKYQLQIIPKSGHIIEEDQPEDVANVVSAFASRYHLLNIEGVPNFPRSQGIPFATA